MKTSIYIIVIGTYHLPHGSWNGNTRLCTAQWWLLANRVMFQLRNCGETSCQTNKQIKAFHNTKQIKAFHNTDSDILIEICHLNP